MYPERHHVNAELPDGIRIAFSEAVSCVKAKAFTAGAIMCRKTLEGACKESGASERTLAASLKELKDAGVIDERLAEWAMALRMSGNEAAHDINVRVSAEDARDLIEFTGAFLENLFILKDRFDKFMARRRTKKSAKGPPTAKR